MSQNQTSRNENLLSLVRLSLGKSGPVLWDDEESSQTWIRRGVDIILIEKPDVVPSSRTDINSERLKAVEQCETEWVWLVDADVVPTENFYVSLAERLKNLDSKKMFGGLYGSLASQSIWEKSYNRICNLWSLAHQTPLAGNLIFHKSLIPKISGLSRLPFGAEEHHLRKIASEQGAEIEILPFRLPHLNGKSLRALAFTCRDQAQLQTPPAPKRKYFRLLKSSFLESPAETAIAIAYFSMSAVLSSLAPKSKSH